MDIQIKERPVIISGEQSSNAKTLPQNSLRSPESARFSAATYITNFVNSFVSERNDSDESEFKVQHYEYSSFGKLALITDGNGNDVTQNPPIEPYFSYTGREYDRESGLYYYRARSYDANVGRFLQIDPDPGYLNRPLTFTSQYIYVLNGPVNFTDPSGRSLFGDFGKAAWNNVKFGYYVLTGPFTAINDPAKALGNLMSSFNLSLAGQPLNRLFTGSWAKESSFQGRRTVENSMFAFGHGFTMGPVSFLPPKANTETKYHEIGHQLQYERDGGWSYVSRGIKAQWLGGDGMQFECEPGELSKQKFNLNYYPDTGYNCGR